MIGEDPWLDGELYDSHDQKLFEELQTNLYETII